jgi:Na+-translocating ferredoxin:NAD+ oxidoreductase RnfA subunit
MLDDSTHNMLLLLCNIYKKNASIVKTFLGLCVFLSVSVRVCVCVRPVFVFATQAITTKSGSDYLQS